VLDRIAEVRARRGMTVIIVSYDAQVGARADRMVTVTDGVIDQAGIAPSISPPPAIHESVRSPADTARCR